MKWKELMKRKKLLSLLLAGIATFTIIFVSSAVKFITTESAADNLPGYIISGDIGGDMLIRGSDGMHPLTLPDDTTIPTLPALNSKGTKGLHSEGSFKMLLADSSSLTQVADDAAGDPGPAQNTKDSTSASSTSDNNNNNSTPILIPANNYPEYDRDVQVANYNDDQTSSGKDDVTTPAVVPEPSTMILLGSGLLGLAVLRKRLRKREDRS